MSTIRSSRLKAYQNQPQSQVESTRTPSRHIIKESYDPYSPQHSLDEEREHSSVNQCISSDSSKKNIHNDSEKLDTQPINHLNTNKRGRDMSPSQDDKDILETNDCSLKTYGDDSHLSFQETVKKKEVTLPMQGIGIGINSGIPIINNLNNEGIENMSTLLSEAMSSLSSFTSVDESVSSMMNSLEKNAPSVFLAGEEASAASRMIGSQESGIAVSKQTLHSSLAEPLNSLDSSFVLLKDSTLNPSDTTPLLPLTSLKDPSHSSFKSENNLDSSFDLSKDSTLNPSDATSLLPLTSLKDPSHLNVKSEGALGASGSLGSTISKSLSSSIRTGNLSSLLDELTATVSQARLNSTNGQDITFQFRSDVLDRTSVRISGNTKQMEVAFSTRSAASNAMLNNHLITLQNHLMALCPSQAIEVKTQFLTAQNSSEFSSEGDTQDDFSNLNQENRGDFQDHGDTL